MTLTLRLSASGCPIARFSGNACPDRRTSQVRELLRHRADVPAFSRLHSADRGLQPASNENHSRHIIRDFQVEIALMMAVIRAMRSRFPQGSRRRSTISPRRLSSRRSARGSMTDLPDAGVWSPDSDYAAVPDLR